MFKPKPAGKREILSRVQVETVAGFMLIGRYKSMIFGVFACLVCYVNICVWL